MEMGHWRCTSAEHGLFPASSFPSSSSISHLPQHEPLCPIMSFPPSCSALPHSHSKGTCQPEAETSETMRPQSPFLFPKCLLSVCLLLLFCWLVGWFCICVITMEKSLTPWAGGALFLLSLLTFTELCPQALGLHQLPWVTMMAPSNCCSFAERLL